MEVRPKLQQDSDNSKTWAKQHKMKIHYDKTTCMLAGSRHKTRIASGLNIHIENNKLKQFDKEKLLDVFIDENLSWTAHNDNLCSAISSNNSFLEQLSLYVPVEIQELFYQGYILPLIYYC